jgi:hypothetical protein
VYLLITALLPVVDLQTSLGLGRLARTALPDWFPQPSTSDGLASIVAKKEKRDGERLPSRAERVIRKWERKSGPDHEVGIKMSPTIEAFQATQLLSS